MQRSVRSSSSLGLGLAYRSRALTGHWNPYVLSYSVSNPSRSGLVVMQQRGIGWGWVRRYRERKHKRQSNQAWMSEARRFMEYEEYTMSSFKSHQLLVVKSYEEAGWWRRLMRYGLKIINREAFEKQMSAVEESRSVVQIIEAMPKASLVNPREYFRGGRRGRLAHEAKLSSAEIMQVIQKFENNQNIHKCMTERVRKGEDIPENSDAVFDILMKPEHMERSYREHQLFNYKNRNRKNKVFDDLLNDNERMFESPWRRRPFYRYRRKWYQRDWRLYQPKWETTERLTLTPDSEDVMSDYTIWRRDPFIKNIYIPRDDNAATVEKEDRSVMDNSNTDALQIVGSGTGISIGNNNNDSSSSVTVSASRQDRTDDMKYRGAMKKKNEPWNVQPPVDFEVLEMSIPDRARNPYKRLHHLRFRLKKRGRHKRYHEKRHRFVCEEGRHSVLRDVRPKVIGARNKQQPMEAVDPERFGYSRWELRNKEL